MNEQLDDKLELLLVNKSFNSLSLVEKEYVLQLISEEEYNQYHLLLSNSLLALNSSALNLSLSSEIEENLKRAFKIKYKKSFLGVIYLENYNLKIPVYQPLLALIVIVAWIMFQVNLFNTTRQQSVAQKTRPERIIGKTSTSEETQKEEIAFKKSTPYGVSVSEKIAENNSTRSGVTNKRIVTKNPEIEIRDPEAITNYLCSDVFMRQEDVKSKIIDSTTPCINVRLIIPDAETHNGSF